jgi:16S rRNA (uracil1498-N3)-methyltransferase
MRLPNTRRFFVAPEAIVGDQAIVRDAELAHQLGRVLRLAVGDHILLLDGSGNAYEVELSELGRELVRGQVVQQEVAQGEPALQITLYIALLRAERFEWVLQKGTELGVSRFVPVQFARSLPADRADSKKLARWSRIIREAAEQACRGILPPIVQPISFAQACSEATSAELSLILWEGEAPSLRSTLRKISQSPNLQSPISHFPISNLALLSGPEGGISEEELTTASEHGIIPVSLGPRILRAETAPIAAVAATLYQAGEM